MPRRPRFSGDMVDGVLLIEQHTSAACMIRRLPLAAFVLSTLYYSHDLERRQQQTQLHHLTIATDVSETHRGPDLNSRSSLSSGFRTSHESARTLARSCTMSCSRRIHGEQRAQAETDAPPGMLLCDGANALQFHGVARRGLAAAEAERSGWPPSRLWAAASTPRLPQPGIRSGQHLHPSSPPPRPRYADVKAHPLSLCCASDGACSVPQRRRIVAGRQIARD